MIYRKLGRSGISVGTVALGCEGFAGKTESEAKAIMDCAIAAGVNFIDIYSPDPALRSTIGAALAGHGDFVVQGHLCSVWKNGQYERTRDLSETKAAFADLQKRLNRRTIDVGMIHYIDAEKDFDTVFCGPLIEYAKELKADGVIRAIGISSHNPIIAKRAVASGLVDVLMFSVNPCYDMQPPNEDVEQLWADDAYAEALTNFNRDREELYELCERAGCAIDVMKAFAGGDLLNADLSPFGRALTPVQCMNYALTRPAVAAVMAGCHSIAELEQSLAWCTATEEEKDYASVLANLEKFTWKGHCMYCGHCAPCPKGVRVADVNKFLNLALAQGEVPETVREHYKVLERHASDCIACGACEKRCPFGVEIRKKMKQAAGLFGY